MEHRRVGGVVIAAEGAAGHDDAERRLAAPAWCGSAPARCACAAACAAVRRRGRQIEVSCSCRAGWSGGMLSAVKLWKSSSICGPSATVKPISPKIATTSSMVWLIGWMRPSGSARDRQGHIDALGLEARGQRRGVEPAWRRGDRRLDLVLELVEARRPGRAAPRGRARPAPSSARSRCRCRPSAATRTCSSASLLVAARDEAEDLVADRNRGSPSVLRSRKRGRSGPLSARKRARAPGPSPPVRRR